MDALEFIRERNRMCRSFIGRCDDCPADKINCCDTFDWNEEIVSIVEKWSKENQRKTRQDVFLEQWPEAVVADDGVLSLCPAALSSTHRKQDGRCGSQSESCNDCYREFWMQEVDNG